MTRQVAALGVVVPAREDAAYAVATVRALLASADATVVPVTVVLVDDGGNDGFGADLPADPRLTVVRNDQHGPGHARTAGAQTFARIVGKHEAAWLISLDADVSLGDDFLPSWVATIESSDEDVLGAPAFFGSVGHEPGLLADVEAASSWMWADTGLYEHLVGLVNVGGCNHAVSLSVCETNGWYLQPLQVIDGVPTIVAGDDWDFGLRARISGFTTARVAQPGVTTSTRRIAADPVGFLAGRSYERAFVPVRGGADPGAWPPEEPWQQVASRGRARLVAHFLAKPLLAGLPASAALEWFLGVDLRDEIEKLAPRAPRWQAGDDWNDYRTKLVELCFSDEVFAWSARVAGQIAGTNGW